MNTQTFHTINFLSVFRLNILILLLCLFIIKYIYPFFVIFFGLQGPMNTYFASMIRVSLVFGNSQMLHLFSKKIILTDSALVSLSSENIFNKRPFGKWESSRLKNYFMVLCRFVSLASLSVGMQETLIPNSLLTARFSPMLTPIVLSFLVLSFIFLFAEGISWQCLAYQHWCSLYLFFSFCFTLLCCCYHLLSLSLPPQSSFQIFNFAILWS